MKVGLVGKEFNGLGELFEYTVDVLSDAIEGQPEVNFGSCQLMSARFQRSSSAFARALIIYMSTPQLLKLETR